MLWCNLKFSGILWTASIIALIGDILGLKPQEGKNIFVNFYVDHLRFLFKR